MGSTHITERNDQGGGAGVDWEKIAPGIWRARFGEAGDELAYTSLAARAPREDALGALSDCPFPFAENPIAFRRYDDRMIRVAIPAEPGEEIHGLGLQLGGTLRTGEALDLSVDHWGGGAGRTHAPVPFYVSSRGYGLLFNTARRLKIHVQCTNRKDATDNPKPVDRNPPPDETPDGPWMAVPTSGAVEAHLSARGVELILFAGESPLDVVSRYNLFCGGGAMPRHGPSAAKEVVSGNHIQRAFPGEEDQFHTPRAKVRLDRPARWHRHPGSIGRFIRRRVAIHRLRVVGRILSVRALHMDFQPSRGIEKKAVAATRDIERHGSMGAASASAPVVHREIKRLSSSESSSELEAQTMDFLSRLGGNRHTDHAVVIAPEGNWVLRKGKWAIRKGSKRVLPGCPRR